MADVQVQQTPNGGGTANWVWAVVVIVVLALILFFVLGGRERTTERTDVNIDVPEVSTPNVPEVNVPENVDVNVRTPEGGTRP